MFFLLKTINVNKLITLYTYHFHFLFFIMDFQAVTENKIFWFRFRFTELVFYTLTLLVTVLVYYEIKLLKL